MSDATILLVDDDAVLSQVLQRVLIQQGYSVIVANSVADAVDKARQHPVRLGLIDLCLPDGDGVELARRLRKEVGALPLILMTSAPQRLRDEPGISQGFAKVLTKPFNVDELRQVIEQTLSLSRSARKRRAAAPPQEKTPAQAEALNPQATTALRSPEAERGTEKSSTQGPQDVATVAANDKPRRKRLSRLLKIAVGLAILIVVGVVAALIVGGRAGLLVAGNKPAETKPAAKPRLAVELVEETPHTIRVPQSVQKGLAIQESIAAKPPKQTRPLLMPGSTALDPARIMRVKTRFNAEVIEMGQVIDSTQRTPEGETVQRALRPGDTVRKGDVLAVVWSVDVGSKKSDLVDALVQLRLDEKRLKAREELFRKGSLPEDTLNQTRRDVITDRNAKERAERILRTWNIPEREIKEVYDEAELASERLGKRDPQKERRWARSELVAPRAGTIIECNVTVGEYVADNTINLFTIADVNRLLVMANPPEDLLPELLALNPEQKRWKLEMAGSPTIEGPIEEVGYLIDANQHTAVIKGYINNPQGKLRAGQYVSATVNLPPPDNVVEVPLTALAEDGKQSFVFIQPDPTKPVYTMRRVKVTLRFEKVAFVKSRLTKEEQTLTPEEKELGLDPPQPLKRGERFVPAGVLELRSAVEDLESKAVKKQ